MDAKAHWELVFRTNDFDQVSWFQQEPTLSIDMIRHATADPRARVVDVGGGASPLADALLREGYSTITILDVSSHALEQARERLGSRSPEITWMECDVLTAVLREAAFDVWHDRAVFHFLIDPTDRARYLTQLRRSLRPGGHAVIATFAEDGPQTCSGLPVARYSPGTLEHELGERFTLVNSAGEQHVTPSGSRLSFVYCLFRFHA